MSPKLPDGNRPSPSQHRGRDNATLLGIAFLLLFALGFLALLAAVLPGALGLVFVFLGIVGFIAFHYFTWGIWLSRKLRDSEESGEE